MQRLVVAVLAALVFSFGAQADPSFFHSSPFAAPLVDEAKAGDYSKIKTVAIVSTIGQKAEWFRENWVSTKYYADIRPWGLDDLVEAALRRSLKDRFKIVDANLNRASLPTEDFTFFSGAAGKLKAYFATQQTPPEVDAYIIVRPFEGESTDFTNIYYRQAGRYIGGKPAGAFGVHYVIEVIDAKSLKTISKAESRIRFRGENAAMAPVLDVGGIDFPREPPTPAVLAKARPVFEMLVSMSLLETLRALEFGVTLPPIGGRTTMTAKPDELEHTRIKTVAVASGIGDELQIANPGFFPNVLRTDNHLPIAEMKLDELVETQARTILAKRFTVKDIAFDRTALAKARVADKDDKDIETVPGLTAAGDIDAYVVFLKTPGNSPYPWHGPGIVEDWRAGKTGCVVFVYYQAVLVDAKTLKILSWYRGQPSLVWPRDVPWRDVDPTLWPGEKAATLTPEQHDKIAAVLKSELSDSVPETLLIMGLTDQTVSFHSFLKPDE